MKIPLTLIFFLFCNTSIFSQNYQSIPFDGNAFALKDSFAKDLSFNQVVKQINNYNLNDTQKLCLVAGWIYDNIDFDLEKFASGGIINDYQTVLKLKKGTCGDYATLFAAFCNQLKIKNEIIEGYVQEYDTKSFVFYETNHAWNVVQLGGTWYHCDLLGFSGYIKKDESGKFQFIKQEYAQDFLTQDFLFIAEHIPADPMWQLSHYPMPLATLIANGNKSKTDSTQRFYDFQKMINQYIQLPNSQKLLKFAEDAYAYNKNNANVIIVDYFNAAVDLINNWNHDKKKLVKAKQYLTIAKSYAPKAKNGVESLTPEINQLLKKIDKFVL